MLHEQNKELCQRGLQKRTHKNLIRIPSNTKPRHNSF